MKNVKYEEDINFLKVISTEHLPKLKKEKKILFKTIIFPHKRSHYPINSNKD